MSESDRMITGEFKPSPDTIEAIQELQDEANLAMGRTNPPLSQKFQELLRNRKLIQ